MVPLCAWKLVGNQKNGPEKNRASHRGDQGGPLVPLGEKKKNKGGPGGTSLPLSVPKLPTVPPIINSVLFYKILISDVLIYKVVN